MEEEVEGGRQDAVVFYTSFLHSKVGGLETSLLFDHLLGLVSKNSCCSPAHPIAFLFLIQQRPLFGELPSPRYLPPHSSLSSDFKGAQSLWHFH